MGASNQVNMTWKSGNSATVVPRGTTYGRLLGAGFGSERSLKVFPALAPDGFRGFLFGLGKAPSPRVGDPKGVVASLRR